MSWGVVRASGLVVGVWPKASWGLALERAERDARVLDERMTIDERTLWDDKYWTVVRKFAYVTADRLTVAF